VRPLPVDEKFRNPWPAAWDEAFWNRANTSLSASDIAPGKYGGTYFENEKASYPNAFIGFLKGQRADALKYFRGCWGGPNILLLSKSAVIMTERRARLFSTGEDLAGIAPHRT